MHTTMVPAQVKTLKIQVEVQVSGPEDIFSIGRALEDFILLYLYLLGTLLPKANSEVNARSFVGLISSIWSEAANVTFYA
ncbi:hypothetical protein Tco_0375170 [Tanacetum coccineum]